MAKRIQEQKEERIVSKSRLSMNCSSCLVATSSSAASSPIAWKSPGTVGASGRPGSRMNLEASSFDAYLGGLKEEQYKPVARTNENCGKPLAGETAESSPAFQRSQNNKEATMGEF